MQTELRLEMEPGNVSLIQETYLPEFLLIANVQDVAYNLATACPVLLSFVIILPLSLEQVDSPHCLKLPRTFRDSTSAPWSD